ncbi:MULTISPECIES: hemerythrin domain-containing protein [unclassified Streptomyces]|uniref:hemerythrin domain-containing protein n=1 Tax=unclassified Streptomyces TaxID=2593676 RepID=UPI0029B50FD6|nr:hemerythrin domain-containing protein [Streptomyces sp. DK15]MDX2396090.1 hemerythrin domain-containing protein [Streptomyces sp. DK15]
MRSERPDRDARPQQDCGFAWCRYLSEPIAGNAIDLTVVWAAHAALRRELVHLDRVTTAVNDDAGRVLSRAAGWRLLKQALHAHHRAEDDVLWPALRRTLADRPQQLALLEALEAEHAVIRSVIKAIDAALADPQVDHLRLGDLVDTLVTGLAGHLDHEEEAALPLIQGALTAEQWDRFSHVHAQHIARYGRDLLPWLLAGADEATVEKLLAPLPAATRSAFTDEWLPAYLALERWGPGSAH